MTKLIQKTKVFVLTTKNSLRKKKISKKLKSLKIKFKFFYAIDGRDLNNYEILKKKYNNKKSLEWSGKKLSYPEISCAEAHLRMYKYIVKKKISKAVIMEDDCFPSKLLFEWVSLDFNFNKYKYDVIQIFYSFGIVYRIANENISNKFSLHKACFNIPYTTCYQITKSACSFIIKNNKKIFSPADWPVNFTTNKIRQYVVLPQFVFLTKDHIKTSFQKNKWKMFTIFNSIKKIIPFYNFLTAIYFLSHIPYFIGLQKNYDYYKQNFLLRKIFYIKNIFSNNYLNLNR